MRDRPPKRLRQRLRISGYVFLITLGLTAAGAINTGNNLLYLIVGGILSFVLMSYLLSALTLRRIQLIREAPRAVHRGDPFRCHFRIENRKWSMPAMTLRIESEARPGESTGFIAKVPARCAALLPIETHINVRGVHRLPPVDLVSSFPFGLLDRRIRFEDDLDVVVYPRVFPLRPGALEKTKGARYLPQITAPDGDEFFGLREYIRGDDVRRIAWRVSARLGVWIIREMARDNARCVTVVLDTRRLDELTEFDARFEDAVDLTASIAVSLLARNYDVGIATPTSTLDEGKGAGQGRKVLEMLARVAPSEPEGHSGFDAEVHALQHKRSVVILVSPDPRLWGRALRGSDVRAVDPREMLYA